MKAKSISIITFVPLCLLLLPNTGKAQWSVGIEYNMALPITGYGEVFKTGSNFNLEGKYHFTKGWGIGFQTGPARFANSKEGSIAVNDPKLTVVPLIFTGEYEASREKTIRPFFAAGLGLSIYTFSYYVDNPAQSTNETNASFTMSPQIGVRFFITENTMSYLKEVMFSSWMVLPSSQNPVYRSLHSLNQTRQRDTQVSLLDLAIGSTSR